MQQKPKIKISSNRNFGLVFFVVFLIIALWPILNKEDLRLWSIAISLIFLILGLLNSKILMPLNIVWSKFGIMLGNIIAPIVMGFVFFLVVTPVGLIMKILGKDLLNLKFNKNKKTYWINRDKQITTMKKQF